MFEKWLERELFLAMIWENLFRRLNYDGGRVFLIFLIVTDIFLAIENLCVL